MKIAVLRANALGDFIFVLPALEALRAQFPDSEIVYLGCPWHREYLKNRPSPVDRVIVVPEINEHANGEFLQSEQFDIVYQLHGGGKFSNPFILQMNAKQTVGLQDKGAPPLDVSIPYVYYQSEYLRYLEVVQVPPVTFMPRISVTKSDRYPFPKPYIIIHPGASDFRRRWPVEKFIQISTWCLENNYKVIITGNETELTNQFPAAAINLGGKLTLNQLTGIISQAELIVSNDTGPYHLAVALNTPAVGIWWCGNMINSAPLFHARHRQVISWQTHCPICNMNVAKSGYPFTIFQNSCKHEASFVGSVQTDEVIEEMKKLLITSSLDSKVVSI